MEGVELVRLRQMPLLIVSLQGAECVDCFNATLMNVLENKQEDLARSLWRSIHLTKVSVYLVT